MIDRVSQAEGILMNTIQSKALIGIGAYSDFSNCFQFPLPEMHPLYC